MPWAVSIIDLCFVSSNWTARTTPSMIASGRAAQPATYTSTFAVQLYRSPSGGSFSTKMALPTAVRRRDQRLEARITPDQKELIERAACVQGRTVTDFVVSALQEAAKQA